MKVIENEQKKEEAKKEANEYHKEIDSSKYIDFFGDVRWGNNK